MKSMHEMNTDVWNLKHTQHYLHKTTIIFQNQNPFTPDNIWRNYFTPAFPSKNAFTSTDIFTTHKNSRAFRFLNSTHSWRINGKLTKRSFLEILEKGPQMALSKAPLFRCSPRFIFLQFPFAADAKRIWRIFRSRHLFLTSPSVWECEIFILLRVLKGKTRNAISCLFSLKGTRGVLHTTRQIEGGSIYCHLFWGGQDLGCVEL